MLNIDGVLENVPVILFNIEMAKQLRVFLASPLQLCDTPCCLNYGTCTKLKYGLISAELFIFILNQGQYKIT